MTWIRIRIHQILWIRIRIQSMRINSTAFSRIPSLVFLHFFLPILSLTPTLSFCLSVCVSLSLTLFYGQFFLVPKGTVYRFYIRVHRNSLQFRNTSTIFHPFGRNGWFYGVKARSNCGVNITNGQFWPLRHKTDRSGYRNQNNGTRLKLTVFLGWSRFRELPV